MTKKDVRGRDAAGGAQDHLRPGRQAAARATPSPIASISWSRPRRPARRARRAARRARPGAARIRRADADPAARLDRRDRSAKNVVIAWNGGREALRAVHDAMPILEKAEKVTVFCFSSRPSDLRASATMLVDASRAARRRRAHLRLDQHRRPDRDRSAVRQPRHPGRRPHRRRRLRPFAGVRGPVRRRQPRPAAPAVAAGADVALIGRRSPAEIWRNCVESWLNATREYISSGLILLRLLARSPNGGRRGLKAPTPPAGSASRCSRSGRGEGEAQQQRAPRRRAPCAAARLRARSRRRRGRRRSGPPRRA